MFVITIVSKAVSFASCFWSPHVLHGIIFYASQASLLFIDLTLTEAFSCALFSLTFVRLQVVFLFLLEAAHSFEFVRFPLLKPMFAVTSRKLFHFF